MRIAIAADDTRGLDGVAAHHFGRCPYYAFVDVDANVVQNVEVLPNPYFNNHSPGQVPAFIHQQGAEMMIAGGMGRRAITIFEQLGIRAYTGAAGTVRRALEQALGGALQDATPCAGHDGEHEDQVGTVETHNEEHDEEHGEVHRVREEVAALLMQIAEATEKLDKLQQ